MPSLRAWSLGVTVVLGICGCSHNIPVSSASISSYDTTPDIVDDNPSTVVYREVTDISYTRTDMTYSNDTPSHQTTRADITGKFVTDDPFEALRTDEADISDSFMENVLEAIQFLGLANISNVNITTFLFGEEIANITDVFGDDYLSLNLSINEAQFANLNKTDSDEDVQNNINVSRSDSNLETNQTSLDNVDDRHEYLSDYDRDHDVERVDGFDQEISRDDVANISTQTPPWHPLQNGEHLLNKKSKVSKVQEPFDQVETKVVGKGHSTSTTTVHNEYTNKTFIKMTTSTQMPNTAESPLLQSDSPHASVDSKVCTNADGWNLRGDEWGCCGNYEGCCIYASMLCFLHDMICRCCERGNDFCGPTCRPETGCPNHPDELSHTVTTRLSTSVISGVTTFTKQLTQTISKEEQKPTGKEMKNSNINQEDLNNESSGETIYQEFV